MILNSGPYKPKSPARAGKARAGGQGEEIEYGARDGADFGWGELESLVGCPRNGEVAWPK